jgi:hypothetical protein
MEQPDGTPGPSATGRAPAQEGAGLALMSPERFEAPTTTPELDRLSMLIASPSFVFARMGLVAAIYQDVLLGARNIDGALAEINAAATAATAPPEYCLRLGVLAVMLIANGRPRDAMTLTRLLLAATERAHGEHSHSWIQAATVWIQASLAVGLTPGSSQLHGLTSVSDQLVDRARELADGGQLPAVLSIVGQLWHRIAADDPDADGGQALGRAVRTLEEAACLASPAEAPRIKLALAQAQASGSDAQIEAARTAREAMSSIDRTQNLHEWLQARRLVHELDPDANEHAPVSIVELTEVRDSAGVKAARELLHAEARNLADHGRHAEAGRLLCEAWEPLELHTTKDELAREALLSTAMHMIDEGAIPCRALDAEEAARYALASESLPHEQRLAARVHLALHSPITTDDASAWPIREAHLLGTLNTRIYREALGFGSGVVHATHASRSPLALPAVAFRLEVLASSLFAEVRITTLAHGALASALQRLQSWRTTAESAADPGSLEEARKELEVMLATCAQAAPMLEVNLGDSCREWQLEAGRLLSAPARTAQTSSVILAVEHSAAFKGALTTELLDRAGPWHEGDDGRSYRRQIGEIEASERPVPPTAGVDEDLNEEARRCAWLVAGERFSGDLQSHSRRNLQADYDEMLLRKVTAEKVATPRQADPVLTIDGLFEQLGTRTVLVDMFLGRNADGRYTCFSTLVSKDIRAPFSAPSAAEELVTYRDPQDANRHVALDGMAQLVAHVRHYVRALAGQRRVSREGEQALAAARSMLPIPDGALRELRELGYEHLLLCPHGPLALMPFQLLPIDGGTLADEWTITTITTVGGLLAPPAPAPNRRESLGLVVSADGGTPFGLQPEPRLWEQAAALRELPIETEMLPLGQSTPRAAIEALELHRYVHIAAHGSALDQVPSYHCLFLDPPSGTTNDGRLFAHTVLGADLRGVELVTLCACETAVGRSDRAGNLRGLPLAFMMAGARTVIATLWPVATEPAMEFFVALYRELAGGAAKRDAFGVAQRECRASFPPFADWGAFTYIGDWR